MEDTDTEALREAVAEMVRVLDEASEAENVAYYREVADRYRTLAATVPGEDT